MNGTSDVKNFPCVGSDSPAAEQEPRTTAEAGAGENSFRGSERVPGTNNQTPSGNGDCLGVAPLAPALLSGPLGGPEEDSMNRGYAGAAPLSAAAPCGPDRAGLRLRFHRGLHARGMTQTTFASQAGIGRSHLSQVLAGHRAGGLTWGKLRRAAERLAPELVPTLEQLVPRGALAEHGRAA